VLVSTPASMHVRSQLLCGVKELVRCVLVTVAVNHTCVIAARVYLRRVLLTVAVIIAVRS
jgi:hypothetical protein